MNGLMLKLLSCDKKKSSEQFFYVDNITRFHQNNYLGATSYNIFNVEVDVRVFFNYDKNIEIVKKLL